MNSNGGQQDRLVTQEDLLTNFKGEFMKTKKLAIFSLIVASLTFLTHGYAETSQQARKEAKAECLKQDGNMKGKALQECIKIKLAKPESKTK